MSSLAPGDPGPEEPSASHFVNATMADVKEAKLRAEAVAQTGIAQQKKYIVASDVKWFAGTMAGVAVGAVTLVLWFQGIATAQAQEKSAIVQKALDEHKAAEAVTIAELKDTIREVRVDIRELYKVVQTGRRSERLEQPAPEKDGGR